MKKIVALLLCILLLGSCGNKKDPAVEQEDKQTENAVAQTKVQDDVQEDISSVSTDPQQEQSDGEEVDIDLTELSSTMVYSEVYNMVSEPDKYVDKTVKMKGVFGFYTDEEGKNHFGCVITDATACCAQGVEFVLSEERIYPDEYPKLGSEITVIGNYDYFYDGNFINPILYNAYFS
jgi:hypothetical protein